MGKPITTNITAVFSLIFFCFFACPSTAFCQKNDTATIPIEVVNMETITVIKTDSGEFNHLNGHVILKQGSDTLYCDSALMNQNTHNFEGFGNVRIAQTGGTHGTSDYLKYTSANRMAFMSGNVRMTDGKNNLDCTELTYNLGSKTAVYDKGGKLYNDSTRVTSRTGEYNIGLKQARFKDKVVIIDTQYRIVSEDVMYNTDTKVTVFYAHSVVTRDSGKSILETTDGWYDGKNGIAHFTGFSKIWNDGQYIEGDSLDYNKITGHGIAIGHVMTLDTAHHSKMYCGRAEYFQKQRRLWATIKPVLEQVNGKDTVYIRADSFYSAPMVHKAPASVQPVATSDASGRPLDSAGRSAIVGGSKDSVASAAYDLPGPVLSTRYRVPLTRSDTGDAVVVRVPATAKTGKANRQKEKKGRKQKAENAAIFYAADTTIADSTAPLYFIGYHHVLIFSDSMQGKCDSVCYTRADSLIRMMYTPIVWSHKSQITGDTILLQLDSTTLRRLYVPNNALIVSQSGPEKAHLWDQVQGKTLTAWFDSSAIKKMVVKPDAECIYFSKDDKGAYIGMVQVSSVRMLIHFEDQKIRTIKYEPDVHATLTPMDQADLPNARLSKFKWLDAQRPRNKEELFK